MIMGHYCVHPLISMILKVSPIVPLPVPSSPHPVRYVPGDPGVRLLGLRALEAAAAPQQDRGEGRTACPRAHDAR